MGYTDSYKSLNSLEEKLRIKKMILLDSAFKSGDPNEIVKAQSLLNSIQPREHSDRKSFLIDPHQFTQTLGYRNKNLSISYETLLRMSRTPIINAIIKTRINQIAAFAEPQRDKYSLGFVITKKDRNSDGKMTRQEKRRVNEITDIVMDCGVNNSWTTDDFDTFTRKVIRDSLIYDQMNFEIVTDKRNRFYEAFPVDAKTIRISSTFDDDDYKDALYQESKEIKGYYPSYVQIYDGVVENEFYPWELCFGVRNPDTDIHNFGYGISEVEELVRVITAMLWADDYNMKFFSQGSAPKGILKVNGSINPQKLQEFKQQWQAMVSGVHNAWKTPVIESGEIDFINMQTNNRDMEYSQWNEYLIKVGCATFSISPEEVGFAGTSSSANTVFESNNENKVKHSKDKGLYPLLKFYQNRLNRYIIERIDPEYNIRFVGMDAMSKAEELDAAVKKVSNYMTLDEVREEMGHEPLKREGVSDNVMSSMFSQFLMMQQQAESGIEEQGTEWEIDEENENDQELTEDDNPFIE